MKMTKTLIQPSMLSGNFVQKKGCLFHMLCLEMKESSGRSQKRTHPLDNFSPSKHCISHLLMGMDQQSWSFMTQNWDGHRIFPLKVVTLEENGSVRKSVRGMRITGCH